MLSGLHKLWRPPKIQCPHWAGNEASLREQLGQRSAVTPRLSVLGTNGETGKIQNTNRTKEKETRDEHEVIY